MKKNPHSSTCYKTKQEAKESGEFEIRTESIVTLIAVILGNNNERCLDKFCFYQEKKSFLIGANLFNLSWKFSPFLD